MDDDRAIYLSHKQGGSLVTLPNGKRRIVMTGDDLATACRDSVNLEIVAPEATPSGRRIAIEAIEGGVIATISTGSGDSQFVLPDDNGTEAAAQLWDALTVTSPTKILHDVERVAFEAGDPADKVSVPVGDFEITATRGQLRNGARGLRHLKSFFQFASRPGPRARKTTTS